MPIHAELHRHLGGAIVPRIFWRYLARHQHPLMARFPTYESLEAFFTRPRASLTEYLELHALVEPVQQLETLPYFVSKLVRGVYVFESITYREVLEKRLKVMDTTAISLCMDNKLPIIVFNVREPGNMRRVVLGERVGTKVTGS